MITQKERVLQVLRERGANSLTSLEALEACGTMRLAAYVRFLKDDGHNIISERIQVPSGKYVAKYTLIELSNPAAPTGFLFDVSKDAAKN